ncbi:ArsR/SmtB family transcription factor [Haloplanus aerogenes]|uniref:Citrate synthase n=1 Tax=Haloplanus aerogenes TaxID=660522 RepID=A0A3M0CVU2_9EURY|nr:helix-turn-helix transcriptional regulator [Haloplanus aerogenes]AZH27088.1 transcriptional regulator [Haloplanus aerogenes]RMB13411.1 citrate synthase [Haloplanus aerogenes]
MAIPDWTWGDAPATDALTGRPSPSTSPPVDPLAETLSTLSHPARLEILFALVRADGPLDYTSLRAATSVADKGQFNYHLRQLRGRFVADRDDGYVPTTAGRSAVRTLSADDHLRDD